VNTKSCVSLRQPRTSYQDGYGVDDALLLWGQPRVEAYLVGKHAFGAIICAFLGGRRLEAPKKVGPSRKREGVL